MSFEANAGQTDTAVRFLARGRGYQVFLTPTEAVIALSDPVQAPSPAPSRGVLRLKLAGANEPKKIEGLHLLPGKSNYIKGKDPGQWRIDVPTYATVQYTGVYPGIDLLYHGNQHQLEYDFVVAPRADPAAIRLDFDGAEGLRVDDTGDLVMQVAGREVRHGKPVIYQESGDVRHEIPGGYVLEGPREVAFEVGSYDAERPLIIDPVFVYSTYLTGAGGRAIAVDSAGNTYIAGGITSPDLPTVDPFQPHLRGTSDAFVAKFSPDGALVYSTYLGGADDGCCGSTTGASDIEVDPAGNMYVAGETRSPDFPVTPNAYLLPDGRPNAFVTKLNASGNALVYSTMVYSGCFDCAQIALDSGGNVWLTAGTNRQDFPTVNPLQPSLGGGIDAIVMQLNAEGSDLLYSTYLGGTGGEVGRGISIDAADNVHVAGVTNSVDFPTVNAAQPSFGGGEYGDAWVAKLNPQGSALIYSTYLGGLDNDFGGPLASDAAGNAYVAGQTASVNFPMHQALQPMKKGLRDAFLAKLDPTGTVLYSTYLGGSDEDFPWGVAADAAGNAYVTGQTLSSDFPTLHSLQPFRGPSDGGDAFVTKVNTSGTALIYSTYLGGTKVDVGSAIAADSLGTAYVAGGTGSLDFPTKNPIPYPPATDSGGNGFVSKIADSTCGEEVTDLLAIHRFGFFRIPFTRFRFQWVLLRNRTDSVIDGPLAFVMDDLENAAFIGSRLRTECFSPDGDPFTVVATGSDAVLRPNEAALAGLWFFKTGVGPITYTPRVLTGLSP